MYTKPFRSYSTWFDITQPLTIKRIWFGNGGETDEFFTVGEDYGRNEKRPITKIVETMDKRARIYSNDAVLCDVLNVRKIDYV